MIIDLSKLDFTFQTSPLLIGGKAMEYYGLRQAGNDIDFVITSADYQRLSQKYPRPSARSVGRPGGVRL